MESGGFSFDTSLIAVPVTSVMRSLLFVCIGIFKINGKSEPFAYRNDSRAVRITCFWCG